MHSARAGVPPCLPSREKKVVLTIPVKVANTVLPECVNVGGVAWARLYAFQCIVIGVVRKNVVLNYRADLRRAPQSEGCVFCVLKRVIPDLDIFSGWTAIVISTKATTIQTMHVKLMCVSAPPNFAHIDATAPENEIFLSHVTCSFPPVRGYGM